MGFCRFDGKRSIRIRGNLEGSNLSSKLKRARIRPISERQIQRLSENLWRARLMKSDAPRRHSGAPTARYTLRARPRAVPCASSKLGTSPKRLNSKKRAQLHVGLAYPISMLLKAYNGRPSGLATGPSVTNGPDRCVRRTDIDARAP